MIAPNYVFAKLLQIFGLKAFKWVGGDFSNFSDLSTSGKFRLVLSFIHVFGVFALMLVDPINNLQLLWQNKSQWDLILDNLAGKVFKLLLLEEILKNNCQ